MTGGPSLRERVARSAGRIPGAPERQHFLQLLTDAEGFRLDDAAAGAVARTLDEAAEGVESNLDLLRLSSGGVWIEFADAPRRREAVSPLPGSRHPVDVGVLICVDPEDDDLFVVMAAWDFEPAETFGDGEAASSVRHGYAAVVVSRDELSQHAYAARRGVMGPAVEAELRILSRVHAYVPAGLGDELGLVAEADHPDDREAVEDVAMRDVVAEAPFALAALLFLSSRGCAFSDPDSSGIRSASLRLSRFGGVARRVFGRGFRREGRAAEPRLAFRAA